MVNADWRVEISQPDLRLAGVCDVWTSLDLSMTVRAGGTWILDLPATHPQAALFTPGCSVSVWAPWSQAYPELSGPATSLALESGSGSDGPQLTVTGVDDTAMLGDRLVLPDPSADLDLQTAESHWTDSGRGEALIRRLAAANAGESALAARRFLLADPTGRLTTMGTLAGSVQSISCRFDNLLEVVGAIAALDGLTVRVVQPASTPQRHLLVTKPTDRPWIVFSPDRGNLKDWSATLQAPKATRVLVAGQGQGTDRTLLQRSTATEWERRVETFVDARDTNDMAVLAQRGDEALAQGVQTAAATISPQDLPTLSYGRDYQLGDTITARIGSVEIAEPITAVRITVTEAGANCAPTIGDATAGSPLSWTRTPQLATRIGHLERRT